MKCHNTTCSMYDPEEDGNCKRDTFCMGYVASRPDAIKEVIEEIRNACDNILELVEQMEEKQNG